MTYTIPDMAPQVVIGRDTGCDLTISGDPYVSPRHARVYQAGGRFWIEDCASTNGTFVNGVKVPLGSRAPIRKGDTIRVGRTDIPW